MASWPREQDGSSLGQWRTGFPTFRRLYLAKLAASIGLISVGRLEMGIGAGWYEHEHDGYGYPFVEPAPRIKMLEEGVEIIKAIWTEEGSL